MKSTRKTVFALLCFFLFGSQAACKKGEGSANHVLFSLNGGIESVCTVDIRPNYDYLGGPNCDFQFDRLGGTSSFGNDDIGLSVSNDCNMVTGSIPYRTNNFTLAINVYGNVPGPTTYFYPFTGVPGAGSLGNLTLTITGRESHRVTGTVSGIIYRSNVIYEDSATVNCSFDLDIPVTKQ